MAGYSHYYEKLVFSTGSKINVSRQVDTKYFNTVHWHPYVEILVSRCDGNEAMINFNRYRLNQNDIAVAYSGDLHAVQYVKEDSFLIIQFPIALLAVMGELNGLLPRLSRLNCIRYDPDLPESFLIKTITEKIEQHHYSDGSFREVLVYADLLNLFAIISRKCILQPGDNPAAETSTEHANLKLMAEACLYISENCSRPLSLNDVAAHVGVSRSHFAHLFKNYTSATFIEFLTIERIKLSETFFMNPQLHITDIAFESGFSSISSFNRAFKKIKGCSPTDFRSTMIN